MAGWRVKTGRRFVAGAGTGDAGLQRAAVRARRSTPEKRHPVRSASREPDASRARWLTAPDAPVKLFDLAPQGFAPSAADCCPMPAGRARSSCTRTRPASVTVYLRKPDTGRSTPPPRRSATSARATSACSTGSRAGANPRPAALVGSLPREKLLALRRSTPRARVTGQPARFWRLRLQRGCAGVSRASRFFLFFRRDQLCSNARARRSHLAICPACRAAVRGRGSGSGLDPSSRLKRRLG